MTTTEYLKKVFCSYLPYGVKAELTLDSTSEIPWYMKEDGIYPLSGMMLDWYDNEVRQIKPFLRHLDDLIKPIEIDGVEIIPIIEMAYIADCHFKHPPKLDYFDCFEEDGCNVIRVYWKDKREDFFEISWDLDKDNELKPDDLNDGIIMCLGETTMIHNAWNVFQILFKYHFDVFGLIPKGHALHMKDIKSIQNDN